MSHVGLYVLVRLVIALPVNSFTIVSEKRWGFEPTCTVRQQRTFARCWRTSRLMRRTDIHVSGAVYG